MRKRFGPSANSVLKDKQTAGFILTHNRPDVHLTKTSSGPMLDLQSLVADFREAVDNLGALLRASPELREAARTELETRAVRIISVTIERPGSAPGASATGG